MTYKAIKRAMVGHDQRENAFIHVTSAVLAGESQLRWLVVLLALH